MLRPAERQRVRLAEAVQRAALPRLCPQPRHHRAGRPLPQHLRPRGHLGGWPREGAGGALPQGGRGQGWRRDTLVLLPFQPIQRYPEVLGAGDILLAMIGEAAAGFSVPSRILSYLVAGEPIVASIAAGNDAAATIAAAQAGAVVPPGDQAGFCQAALRLADDPARRRQLGRNARAFAESSFDVDDIAQRFEQVLAHHETSATRASAVEFPDPLAGQTCEETA